MKDTFFSNKLCWNIKGIGQLLTDRPLVMGIVNATPDSFYAKSRVQHLNGSYELIDDMIKEGADILDLGAASSRPGATEVSPLEEIERLAPVLSYITKNHPKIPVAIDTFYKEVAAWAIGNGAHIINDISAGARDDQMLDFIATQKVPYIMMHMQGDSKNMDRLTNYDDILFDIMAYFQKRIVFFEDRKHYDLMIDPGFGFAKTMEQNYVLLRNLHYFEESGYPVLAGISRKRMIYQLLETDADHALNGTTAANMLALLQGAQMLRVHDVKEAVETVSIFKQYESIG